ncbi:MAG: glycosyltransferase family 2 protein [Bacteroidales bacterium]|nr:glycosyltransferase family 2 protein [Bacteroidales bacterium]
MKRIAALTMVRNDDFFLGKWTAYYGDLLGKDNLFIFFDGEDQKVPDCTAGCHVEVIPRVAGNVRVSDKERIGVMSARAARLLKEYDMVIGSDVDEFLIVDPSVGKSLPEFLSEQKTEGRNSLSGLGCDVIQDTSCEPALDFAAGILSQRKFVRLSPRYTKTSVLLAPVEWGSGFHRTRRGDFHIIPNLYLFHFGCADTSFIGQKLEDKDLASRGWDRHLHKRRRLIDNLPALKERSWDVWTVRARKLQSVIRLPYTPNKPAMLNLQIKVRLPERFSGLV